MQVVSAIEVESQFWQVSNIVQGGELVLITENGEPEMVLFPVKFAQEVLESYSTTNNQQGDGEELLKWLKERTPISD